MQHEMTKIKAVRGKFDVYSCYEGREVVERCSDKVSAARWMGDRMAEGGCEIAAKSDVTAEDVTAFFG